MVVFALTLALAACRGGSTTVEAPQTLEQSPTAAGAPDPVVGSIAIATHPGEQESTTTLGVGPVATVASTVVSGPAATPVADWSWRQLPPVELVARQAHSLVWTESEVIVWGGLGGRERLRDGAAFDPAIKRWRPIADAPIVGRGAHSAVWTGTEMIVWGGEPFGCFSGVADGAAYDPVTDTWRSISDSPVSGRSSHHGIWTGREMVIIGGATGQSVRNSDNMCEPTGQVHTPGGAYDPLTDTWRLIAPGPIGDRVVFFETTWDGHSIYVWGQLGATDDLSFWAYEPATDDWTQLPSPPVTPFNGMSLTWTGSEVVLVGGQVITETSSGLVSDVSAFDPDAGAWRTAAELPVPFGQASTVWTGSEIIAVAGCCSDRSNVYGYNPTRDRWTTHQPLDFRCEGRCTVFTEAVFAGEGVIAWGGGVEIYAGDDIDFQLLPSGAWFGPDNH